VVNCRASKERIKKMIAGFATDKGCRRYFERVMNRAAGGHFRSEQQLLISSIGIGTYLGKWDDQTDRSYTESVERAVELGVNLIDTAANYRFQRSERAIGTAIRNLIEKQVLVRDELIVCTKGGYLPFDGQPAGDVRRYIEETFISTGIATMDDFVEDSHCMTPRYLQSQLDQSLRNLGLSTIDVYYIHNPETQLGSVTADEFYQRLRNAFELLEKNRSEGRIKFYGVATWNGFRADPSAPDYLSLERIVEAAAAAGGSQNGFRFVQIPFNLAMPEALVNRNQRSGRDMVSVIEAASELGISVIASASLLQGRVAKGLPAELKEPLGNLRTDAQTAVQFVRSTPGVTCALIGMSRKLHVEENLELVSIEPAPIEEYQKLFV
jgi:aryl-alcohol dehydrogenase-like predicted oxidoreductase